jgi:hypothetical protein
MRKRKWWFAGLAVALLAACVGVWKWSERPPYAFIEGGNQIDMYINDSFGQAALCRSYEVPAAYEVVRNRADTELSALGWKNLEQVGLEQGTTYSPSEDIQIMMSNLVWVRPGASRGTTLVDVYNPPNWLDQVREKLGWMRRVDFPD